MLSSRDGAQCSRESPQVNTLLTEMTREERNALHAIGWLKPSDSRNVRQQLFYLFETERVTKVLVPAN